MHKTVHFIRKALNDRSASYAWLSGMTGISLSKLKRVFTGRQPMTLEERDAIFEVLELAEEKSDRELSTREMARLWPTLPQQIRATMSAHLLALVAHHANR